MQTFYLNPYWPPPDRQDFSFLHQLEEECRKNGMKAQFYNLEYPADLRSYSGDEELPGQVLWSDSAVSGWQEAE